MIRGRERARAEQVLLCQLLSGIRARDLRSSLPERRQRSSQAGFGLGARALVQERRQRGAISATYPFSNESPGSSGRRDTRPVAGAETT